MAYGNTSVSSLLKAAKAAQQKQYSLEDSIAAYEYDLSPKGQADFEKYSAHLGNRIKQYQDTDPLKALNYQKTITSANRSFTSSELSRATTQVLYDWQIGFTGFDGFVAVGEFFKIQITITATPYGYPEEIDTFCSNCFERIGSDCFTSVVEYGNDEDGFGFKYCYGGELDEEGNVGSSIDCDPTITQFINVSTLSIPYTAMLQSKYGVFPTVQCWIYDGSGQLINMGIQAAFDTYPPTMINFDFGGSASGIIVIR